MPKPHCHNRTHATQPLALALLCVCALGCVQEMEDQPRYEPLEPSNAFDRQLVARDLVPGTVPRNPRGGAVAIYDTAYTTGRRDGEVVTELPEPVLAETTLEELLERGQERYGIFCSHCHDLTGTGNGMVPQRGYPYPPSYHIERLREAPIGHFFIVVTDGYRKMPQLKGQIPVQDRWAIAAYVRALQFSQHAPLSDLPANARSKVSQ